MPEYFSRLGQKVLVNSWEMACDILLIKCYKTSLYNLQRFSISNDLSVGMGTDSLHLVILNRKISHSRSLFV